MKYTLTFVLFLSVFAIQTQDAESKKLAIPDVVGNIMGFLMSIPGVPQLLTPLMPLLGPVLPPTLTLVVSILWPLIMPFLQELKSAGLIDDLGIASITGGLDLPGADIVEDVVEDVVPDIAEDVIE